MKDNSILWLLFLSFCLSLNCTPIATQKSENDLVVQFLDSLNIDWYWCLNPHPKDSSETEYRKYYLQKVKDKQAFNLSLWTVKSFCRERSDMILLVDSNNNNVTQVQILPPAKCSFSPEDLLLMDREFGFYPDTAFENLSKLLVNKNINIDILSSEDLNTLFTLYLSLRYQTEYEEITPFKIDNLEDLVEIMDTLGVRDYESIDKYKKIFSRNQGHLSRNDKISFVYWGPGKTGVEIFFIYLKEGSIKFKHCSYDFLIKDSE
ncbi:MAG: hypothetical protein JNL02_17030 [Saprospiraceae bacterium]|nr:hypothetical protein [Saprospiraceae bacterium]